MPEARADHGRGTSWGRSRDEFGRFYAWLGAIELLARNRSIHSPPHTFAPGRLEAVGVKEAPHIRRQPASPLRHSPTVGQVK